MASVPLYNTDNYGVAPDQFNVVHPAQPTKLDRLRLRVWPKPDAAAGIQESCPARVTARPFLAGGWAPSPRDRRALTVTRRR